LVDADGARVVVPAVDGGEGARGYLTGKWEGKAGCKAGERAVGAAQPHTKGASKPISPAPMAVNVPAID